MKTHAIDQLKNWFLSQRRQLPWRENTTPYAVWVSEVMLQQTQVAVVVPYFLRWMERFPTIEALAKAPLEDVIKEWEGLGYYARARNLHEGARYTVDHYGGELPSDENRLRKIKGLGDYTIGAILNFAFHQRAAAVDGNVLRVLARYYALEDDIGKAKTVKKFQGIAKNLLPENEPWLISEALIELGATVCTRNPKCYECPLNSSCKAFSEGTVNQLPVKAAKTSTTSLYRAVPVIVCNKQVLLKLGEKGKVMAGLYQFPYFEIESPDIDHRHHKKMAKSEFNLELDYQSSLPQVKHSFTRYRALLLPVLFHAKTLKMVQGMEWHSIESLKKLPFSSGHRTILNHFLSTY